MESKGIVETVRSKPNSRGKMQYYLTLTSGETFSGFQQITANAGEEVFVEWSPSKDGQYKNYSFIEVLSTAKTVTPKVLVVDKEPSSIELLQEALHLADVAIVGLDDATLLTRWEARKTMIEQLFTDRRGVRAGKKY